MLKKKISEATLYKYQGNYGGDRYEDWLFDLLSKGSDIQKVQEKRLGGIRTIGALLKLLKSAYLRRGKAIRPFGIPIYLPGMIVIFHHFDHTDLPWYSRALEFVDLCLLRILFRPFRLKVLTVSQYWQLWLNERGLPSEYLVYNDIDVETPPQSGSERQYLASKYSLDPLKAWIFFGGNQKKKGGDAILDEVISSLGNTVFKKYEFIFSGNGNGTKLKKVIWLDDVDYFAFLRQQQLVVANSQFAEGWCRVVHEAILCGVPVAGSGSGGMAELLDLGGGKTALSSDIVKLIEKPPEIDIDAASRLTTFIKEHNRIHLQKLKQYIA